MANDQSIILSRPQAKGLHQKLESPIHTMQIELFGCTSAGKTNLASGILRACRAQGIDLLIGDDFVLKQSQLHWVKSKLARTLLVDLIALFACLVTWRNNFKFYVFTIQIILRLPVAWFEKFNLARNVLKKIGIYEIIRRRRSDQQVVLVDEGTLQAVHNLFVHVSIQPNASDVSTFARLVPLPDLAVYVTQRKSILIERTLERGHQRIPDRSHAKVELFIRRAVDTFDKLVRQSVLKGRLVVVDSQKHIIVSQDCPNDPLFAIAMKIIRSGIDTATAHNPTGIVPEPGF